MNEIVKESKSRGVTFLTAVAGTAVLGVQFAILTPFMTVAASLWVFVVLLRIMLTYTFFAAVTVAEPKPSLEVAINRFWLLVSWEVLHDFQPFIGGYTVFLGDRNGGRRIGETLVKGYRLRSRRHPPPVRFHNCNTTL